MSCGTSCVRKVDSFSTSQAHLMHRRLPHLIYLFLWILPFAALGQRDVPALAGYRIHDEAGILSAQTVTALERSLQVFEDSTSNQIGVLIVNSLEGESIDQFGIRVADQWKLGKADKDNGVILLIALSERKMRIEVGQGLEGPLPDAICNRIIRNEMAPSFRRGDYDGGVLASVDAIRKAIKGEYKGTGPPRRGRGGNLGGFIFLIIIIILAMRGRGNRGRGSGWSAGAGWFIGSALGGGMRGGGGGSWGGGGGGFGGGGSSGSW